MIVWCGLGTVARNTNTVPNGTVLVSSMDSLLKMKDEGMTIKEMLRLPQMWQS
jgi:hypothetical protein